jgi:hypothetical protein
MTGEFQRYLLAKRTVDDRSLDRQVLDGIRTRLDQRASGRDDPLAVLEVGSGIGTMIARFLEWDILPPGEIQYTVLDLSEDNIDALVPHLREWAQDRELSITDTDPVVLDAEDRSIEVTTTVGDATAYTAEHRQEFDLLVGAAFLDIFDLDGLETLLGALSSGGLYYFPIIFDGATRFLPAHPADNHVESQYHNHMDQKPGGDSRAGGAVIERLQRQSGTRLLDVAGSDWFVQPVDDAYPADEQYFLSHILDTVESAVGEMAETDPAMVADWLSTRRNQLERAELSYLTHQLDVFGSVEDPTTVRQNR